MQQLLCLCAAGQYTGHFPRLDSELVRQHSLVFAPYMDQDEDIDGFHGEDFEAELAHVRTEHERLRSKGASQPTIGPLIEQALKDPQSLGRITESIANLGADGDASARNAGGNVDADDAERQPKYGRHGCR